MASNRELSAVLHALAHYGKPIDTIARSARGECPSVTISVALECLELLVTDGVAVQSTNTEGPLGWRLKL